MSNMTIKSTLGQGLATLLPGYFALVMATGIISIATSFLDMPILSWLFLVISILAYTVLALLTLIRFFKYSSALLHDLTDNNRAPGFFTIVAGTGILGSELIIVGHNFTVAPLLWLLSVILWHVIIYAFFAMTMLKKIKPVFELGINGSWLTAVVATQSISILGTLIAAHVLVDPAPIHFFTLTTFLFGCFLYIAIMILCFYRLLFFPLDPQTFSPTYWISMGAAAITTLAGDLLVLHASEWNYLVEILPFLKAMTVFFWSVATWWIPLLVIIGIWRHIYSRVSLVYHPQYWSLVFPLGMYTTCTIQLVNSSGFRFLTLVPHVFVYFAILAWLICFYGLLRHLVQYR